MPDTPSAFAVYGIAFVYAFAGCLVCQAGISCLSRAARYFALAALLWIVFVLLNLSIWAIFPEALAGIPWYLIPNSSVRIAGTLMTHYAAAPAFLFSAGFLSAVALSIFVQYGRSLAASEASAMSKKQISEMKQKMHLLQTEVLQREEKASAKHYESSVRQHEAERTINAFMQLEDQWLRQEKRNFSIALQNANANLQLFEASDRELRKELDEKKRALESLKGKCNRMAPYAAAFKAALFETQQNAGCQDINEWLVRHLDAEKAKPKQAKQPERARPSAPKASKHIAETVQPPSWYAGCKTDQQVKSTVHSYAELFTDAGTEIAA